MTPEGFGICEENPRSSGTSRSGDRLTPIADELLPLQRARDLTRCLLYWIPVDGFPVPAHQRAWLMSFLDRLVELIGSQLGLRAEVFLQKTVVQEHTELFVNTAMDYAPKMGLSHKPGAAFPSSPTKQEIEGLVDQAKKREKITLDKWLPQTCYWFSTKAEKQQREHFFGYGGMTMIFLKPDPGTVPPKLPISPALLQKNELLRMANLDGLLAKAYALNDAFLAKSKELFQDPARKNELFFRGIRFILPSLTSADFFGQPQELFDKWFELFDLYMNESPADEGIVLASKVDIEAQLIGILKQMNDEGLVYPVR